ncbi:PAS domain-containing protein [Flavobacterium sp. K5-23]|uniref:PAS domain-containing protein n=1 Tax=Flavobacterium sp. K5-23 TaxID=2746225 RepID=UPI00201084C0|nr:PAS domain-containing protein [Flavobacterium sp. K5-23]UQD57299.1 PAS domain-containing protein [Flavobacterium sp. K5-23]
MNYIKNLSLKSWLFIVVVSSILLCSSITWVYFKQKQEIKQEIVILQNIRQARIDLTKGFLHIALAENSNSPFKQEVGIAYVNQAIKVFNKSLTLDNLSELNTISIAEKKILFSFIKNITIFKENLKDYNYSGISNPKQETNLRIQFYSLEKQVDQIDSLITLKLNKLSSILNSDFLTALFITAFLLTLICIIFFNLILKINKSNKELSDNQGQLKSLSDNLVNGMIYQVAMPDHNIRKFNYVSNAVIQLYGCTPEEAMENPTLIYGKIHPDDIEDLIRVEKEALENKSVFKKEARVINPDGSIRWSYYVSHARSIEGIVCWDGIEIDITEQKKMEIDLLSSKKQIEESEKKYRIAIDATKDGIWEWNLETNEIIFSKRFYEILGFKGDHKELQLAYKDWEIRIHPEDKGFVIQAIKDHLEFDKDYNVEYRHLHQSNKYRWQNAIGKAIFDENGKPVRMIGSIRDIHKNKIAEKVQNEERNFLKNILESMSDAFVSLDNKWHYTYINSKAGEIFERNPEELIGKNIWEEFPEGLGQQSHLNYEKVMNEKVSIQMEQYYSPMDKWLEKSIFPTENGISIFFTDITNRKKTELELVKAKEKAEESDRLKSAFLANMSHEIRTPMNGILGFSSLLSEPGLDKEEQQEYIKLIQISGARMLNLISEIIDISKIESGMMEVSLREININESVDFVYDLLKLEAGEKSIQLSYNSKLFPALYMVTDPEKLYAVLTNLVKNAIKYTDKGKIDFGYTIKEEGVEFYIKDTGIGIPIERQAAVFDRFIQVDIANIQARQGAGLGLAIAKAFVNLLGGEIWLESQEGIGSTFFFTLPFNTENKEYMPQTYRILKPEIQNTLQLNTKLKILIADDDAISRKLILKSVNEFGKEIIEAKTGRQAVEKFKENPDVDLILMDVQMPEMNGYEATKLIREFNKDVIIITQSAFGLTGDREKAIVSGSNDYITKPIDKTELVILLNKYFTQYQV